MKKLLIAAVMFLAFTTTAWVADMTFAWDANTEPDLAGYKVHWGLSSTIPFTDEVDVGNVLTHQLTDLVEGTTYFFAVTAYDTEGNESAYSDILEYTIAAERVVIRLIDSPKEVRVIWD